MAVDVRARVSEEPSDDATISRNISQVDERAIALIAPKFAFESSYDTTGKGLFSFCIALLTLTLDYRRPKRFIYSKYEWRGRIEEGVRETLKIQCLVISYREEKLSLKK